MFSSQLPRCLSLAMEKLFDSLISVWSWILIVAAGLILGAAVGGLLYYWVGGVVGQALWLFLALVGAGFGVVWANAIAERGQLVQYAGGVHVPARLTAAERAELAQGVRGSEPLQQCVQCKATLVCPEAEGRDVVVCGSCGKEHAVGVLDGCMKLLTVPGNS